MGRGAEAERAKLIHELGLVRLGPCSSLAILAARCKAISAPPSFTNGRRSTSCWLNFPRASSSCSARAWSCFCIGAGWNSLRGPSARARRKFRSRQACQHFDSGVSHWHLPHHHLLGLARLASGLRPRRDDPPGFWETGLLSKDGLEHLALPALTPSSIMLPLFIRLCAAPCWTRPRLCPHRSCQRRLAAR